MTVIQIALTAAVTLLLANASVGADTVFYVSQAGNDGWSGSIPTPAANEADGPLRTLEGARNAVRVLKAAGNGLPGPVTIRIQAGDWFLAEPLRLTPEDSGTQEAPITWTTYGEGATVLTGGQVITDWEDAGDGVWQAQIPEVQRGEWTFRQLFVRRPGETHFLRRYRPSKGALIIAGLTNAPAREGMGHRRSQDEFMYVPGDLEPWENLEDVEIVALHDWSSSRLRIRELDTENHIVRFTGFPVYRIGHWWKGGRNPYYAENVKEQFANPGEWYLDRPTGVLSYRPVEGEDMATLTVVAPRTDQLVILQGDAEMGLSVDHVRFRGITFAHTHWSLPDQGYSSGQGMTDLPAAFQARVATHCAVEDCTFAHLGAYAVDFGGGCSNNRIAGNRMFDLGGGGVKIGGAGPTPTGNVVENNVISDGGLVHFSAHGIWAGITDGTVIRHNIVRRFLYSNISVGWAWHENPTPCKNNVIEANHIHDSMMLLADGGAIYTLGFMPGNVIRGNHIHDVHRSKFAGSAPNNGMFFDQGSKGFLVERNVIYRTSGNPIRHNQNSADWHTWVDNSFGVLPDDPAFPAEIAQAAGLEPPYAHLDAEAIPVSPTPILSMTLPPPPPPGPIVDTSEPNVPTPVPEKRAIQGADEHVHIRVTDETAAEGRFSLKFTDGPKNAKPFYPYLIYSPTFDKGRVTVSFAVRPGGGANIGIEGRTYKGGTFFSGPLVTIGPDGTLKAAEQTLVRLPLDEWSRVEIKFGLGELAGEGFSVRVTLPDGKESAAQAVPMKDERFQVLDWFAFLSHTTVDAVFYLDDVRLENK
ncbi:MAG: right-handed parallel beta-helix repeat-containing protein [Armatimonadetes bacterium]|nr:right-handed parallel beta-helix repeat-containing protein [Armatimonadota bacterium]